VHVFEGVAQIAIEIIIVRSRGGTEEAVVRLS